MGGCESVCDEMGGCKVRKVTGVLAVSILLSFLPRVGAPRSLPPLGALASLGSWLSLSSPSRLAWSARLPLARWLGGASLLALFLAPAPLGLPPCAPLGFWGQR